MDRATVPQADVLDELLLSVRKLRPLPASALRVIELSSTSRSTVDELTQAIDPALASQLFRLANSAYYRQQGTIVSLRDAVRLMGFGAVRTAALASGLISEGGTGPYSSRRFWSHAVTIGEVTQLVGQAYARHRNEAFTAGVLHSIGRMALAQLDSELLTAAERMVRDQHISFETAEEELFGVGDAVLGGALARPWDFPERLVESIERYSVTPRAQADPTALAADVERACALVSACGLSDGIKPPQSRQLREIDADWFSPPLSKELRAARGVPALRDRAVTFVEVALGEGSAAIWP